MQEPSAPVVIPLHPSQSKPIQSVSTGHSSLVLRVSIFTVSSVSAGHRIGYLHLLLLLYIYDACTYRPLVRSNEILSLFPPIIDFPVPIR